MRIRLLFNPANVVIRGECNQCGTCCRNLILVDGKKIIRSEHEFENLKKRFPQYEMFRIKSQNKSGDLIFHCTNLNPDNTCSVYPRRPAMCAAYPTKAMFKRDGKLLDGCGYTVTPAISFREILESETRD